MEKLEILNIRELTCTVPNRTLFSGLNLHLNSGESIAIIGQSGVGKSTLLNTILGLKKPNQGTIHICGHEMNTASARKRAKIRRENIGTVFQDGELFPELSAAENVALAFMLQTPPPKNALAKSEKILQEFGVPPHTMTIDLSGGERQRTAFARALVSKPQLILADEPTGSLDTKMRDIIADELFFQVQQRQLGLLLVTHDLAIAERADTVIDLNDFVGNK